MTPSGFWTNSLAHDGRGDRQSSAEVLSGRNGKHERRGLRKSRQVRLACFVGNCAYPAFTDFPFGLHLPFLSISCKISVSSFSRCFNKALHLKPHVIDFYKLRSEAFLQLCDFPSAIKDLKVHMWVHVTGLPGYRVTGSVRPTVKLPSKSNKC